mmetsp:Transcript_13492/g.38916  ORF Transcript_13492/g.38916 Transcript_13492/m.38916 type:complete len:462 (+) Transcript_13492:324-1709(+)|eukprot:CAMPEP_0176015164 /NCGR_PEP_ID=MMETSP0120_2-20121206/7196_1 /TAXON_ID=160619 /ORGANISM="Kryptoperidinium foliaceum, Strain CCMP 1326" /LENGTH=461 /DNA_ID=CAMNT_0017348125 /DNA_START=313 /DNA_END=1698 /DNA_ORIENTATION=-
MPRKSPIKRKAAALSAPDSKTFDPVEIQVESSSAADNPIVVSFPGGLPESLQKDGSSGATLPQFVWKKLSKRSSSGRKIIGEDKSCVYSASAAGLMYDDRRTKLCVGVYDKKTGSLVLREAAVKGTVFALQQSIPYYLEKNGPVKFEAGRNLLSYDTSVHEDFGSAKKQKALRSQAANRVELQSVVGAGENSAVMNQVVKGESMSESNRKAIEENKNPDGDESGSGNKAVDAAHEAARKKFLPPYDETAVKPHKVYNPREMMGDAAWKRMYNKVHAAMHDNDPTESIVGFNFEKQWQTSTLKVVKAINIEAADCRDRFTCALLANDIIRFYGINHQRRSVAELNSTKRAYFGMPMETAMRCVELFTTTVPTRDGKESQSMSKQDKDKCVVHVLILYMLAHGHGMKIPDLKPIAQDLKIPVNDCGQMLRLAGCQVSKKGATLSAVLTTPLTFPKPKRGIKRN